jgi:hypothetical protein
MTNYFSRLQAQELALAKKIFEVSHDVGLTGSQTTYFQIKTVTTAPMILHLEVSSSDQPCKLTVLENPTVTLGTTAITPYNMYRLSTNQAVTLFYSNPTSISGGTAINTHIITAGKGGSAVSAESGVWILKKNTSYVLKVEQLSNQATTIAFNIVFAEEYGSAP